MNILFYNWKGFGKEDIVESLEHMGHLITCIDDQVINERVSEEFDQRFDAEVEKSIYDFVFSINFRPIISNNCMRHHIKYVSIVYDNPLVSLYSCAIVNKCNYVFLFDSSQYFELKNGGIDTVYYMPLAVNVDRIDRMKDSVEKKAMYSGDVTFVGAMYNEKHNLYDRYSSQLSDRVRGYLDGIMECQLKVYGEYFIQKLLTKDVIEEFQNLVDYHINLDGIESLEYIYSDYFIGRKLAEKERYNLLKKLSEKMQVSLYTFNETPELPKVENKGPVDYYDNMPYVFRYSKINLNIALRTIRKGIPLRAMDIMGSHGFLMSSYQEDFLRHFVAGEDFLYFESEEDLVNRCNYYLSHEKERQQIADNGYGKVKEFHNYRRRLEEIIAIVMSE